MEGEPRPARRPVSAGGIAGGILLLLIAAFCDNATVIGGGRAYLFPLAVAVAAGVAAIALFAINFRRSRVFLRTALALPLLLAFATVANASFRLVWLVGMLTAGKL